VVYADTISAGGEAPLASRRKGTVLGARRNFGKPHGSASKSAAVGLAYRRGWDLVPMKNVRRPAQVRIKPEKRKQFDWDLELAERP